MKVIETRLYFRYIYLLKVRGRMSEKKYTCVVYVNLSVGLYAYWRGTSEYVSVWVNISHSRLVSKPLQERKIL